MTCWLLLSPGCYHWDHSCAAPPAHVKRRERPLIAIHTKCRHGLPYPALSFTPHSVDNWAGAWKNMATHAVQVMWRITCFFYVCCINVVLMEYHRSCLMTDWYTTASILLQLNLPQYLLVRSFFQSRFTVVPFPSSSGRIMQQLPTFLPRTISRITEGHIMRYKSHHTIACASWHQ